MNYNSPFPQAIFFCLPIQSVFRNEGTEVIDILGSHVKMSRDLRRPQQFARVCFAPKISSDKMLSIFRKSVTFSHRDGTRPCSSPS